jgi:hypothetical protein
MKKNLLVLSLFIFITLFLSINPANAQFFESLSNPDVKVNIQHPPGFGIKVKKVVFNTATGSCSDQVIDAMISDFVSNGVEVIARENLQTILKEQNFVNT